MWISVILVEIVLLAFLGILFRRIVQKYTRIGLVWWVAGFLGFPLAGISGARSTRPSSAPRTSVTGTVQDCNVHRVGRSNYTYSFLLSQSGGNTIGIATRIKPPLCWPGPSSDSDGDQYRVVYLDDPSRSLEHEAIRIDVLSGGHVGWSGSVDARPLGTWLGIPAGIVLIIVGTIGAQFHRRERSEPAPATATGHVPVKDEDSDLSDLNLN
jgi:hypothetical protein